jgi:hypothetical protein
VARYSRLLAYPVDAARSLERIGTAFADSPLTVEPSYAKHAPTEVPEWVGVTLAHDRWDHQSVRAEARRCIDAAGLAGEFKPEDVYF